MCNACVINSVKQRMLSRRDLFKTAAAAGTVVAAGSLGMAPPALAAGHQKLEDMTHVLEENFPTFDGAPTFFMEQQVSFANDGYNLFELNYNEHTGTHMDAPFHFSEDGKTVDQLTVGELVVPLCVIDIAARAEEDANAELTPDDISAWIAVNGDIPDNACVAMYSGWEHHLATDKFRNADTEGVMHFPGFHVEAVNMLMDQTTAIGIAVDTLSLDYGQSQDFATHYAWLGSSHWGLENVANLAKVPASGATMIVGAPKHKGGSGGPCRIFAMV